MTSPQLTIRDIARVKNWRQYQLFAAKHESYSSVEGRMLEVRMLFHGTSAEAPKTIIESDTGLDPRLGGGMWGKGSYFAKNSSYSVSYAHRLSNGLYQLFCCIVLVGDYVELPSNNALTRPPTKPGSASLYNSVKGFTGGSEVFITYEPNMSYPSFLITYSA